MDIPKEVRELLKQEAEKTEVVVMPDFFLDRLVNVKFNVDKFSENLKPIAERKGGSIDGIEQADIRGGNAVNTASALAALKVKVTPIICTSKLGLKMLELYFGSGKLDLSHVKISGRASVTTAIEFETAEGKANVMLRDVGSLIHFGPDDLDDRDFEAIQRADYVCVFNWAGTKRFGAALATKVFEESKKGGRGRNYYDTADPSPNIKKAAELVRKVLQSRNLDILSVNENEAFQYAQFFCTKKEASSKDATPEQVAKQSAKTLAQHLSARIDLHTTSFSATYTKKDEKVVHSFKVPVLRATGAGDAWNAGNILGDANKLPDDCRLMLANAVAAYYISNPAAQHPTRKQLLKFLTKMQRKDVRKK
ncbi:MAG: carbohydrate kinase family protein [Candidatus Bathyarchaeota archaeon]|nr:carbohydrate kinase family protein [Candidatus Bathyarchaeota archaeon]